MPKKIYCKNCANLRNDWCEKAVDSPDPAMEIDCCYYKAATNADRIRAMSDEDLAELLDEKECPVKHCPNLSEDGATMIPTSSCRECWLEWLKKEADEGAKMDGGEDNG